MRMCLTIVGCFLLVHSFAFAQSDTLVIELSNGSSVRYPVVNIARLSFAGTPTSVREHELSNGLLHLFTLRQNYPNPFNPSTTIEYEIPKSGEVVVEVFDLMGRRVRLLSNGEKSPGPHRIQWDSRDDDGSLVSSGTYFCKVQFMEQLIAKKLLLVR